MRKIALITHSIILLLLTVALVVHDWGASGRISSSFVYENLYPASKRLNALSTDLKFRIRGPRESKNKIAIVEIDNESLKEFGRWPWPRDYMALLIHRIFEAGARYVALDLMFSEPMNEIPELLKEDLQNLNLSFLVEKYDADEKLEKVISNYRDQLVMAFMTESSCRPLMAGETQCPVTDPGALATLPEGVGRFAFPEKSLGRKFQPRQTPLISAPTMIANIARLDHAAKHVGFVNSYRDSDGIIRRANTVLVVGGKVFPSLALAMANLDNDFSQVQLDKRFATKSVSTLLNDTLQIPPSGLVSLNFRGPARSFPYITAHDVFSEEDILAKEYNRNTSGLSKKELLSDAYVFVGASALALSDIVPTPFDDTTPGVEIHATLLDNLLSEDFFRASGDLPIFLFVLLFLWGGGAALSVFGMKFEGYHSLLFFFSFMALVCTVDLVVFSELNINASTGFLYLGYLGIMASALAAKYIEEQRSKKFLKSAFSKYVAPTVVQSIIQNPKKLALGGEKQCLTVMFADIRNFTSFSESVEAKTLATFLNDYLEVMTKVIFSQEGTLDKYIGDAIMAFWGAPIPLEDHAYRAAISSFHMVQAAAKERERYKQQYGIHLDIGIGIHTGVVNVGNMGSDTSFNYTVIGDDVNLSSRLEAATKFYGVSILSTRTTLDSIKESGKTPPNYRVLGHTVVKGKEEAIEVVQILDRIYSPKGLAIFEQARQAYLEKKWSEAIVGFTESNRLLKQPGKVDGPSQLYLNQCMELDKKAVPDDWDGYWRLVSK